MKRLTISLWFCFVTLFLYGQDFFMYVNGQKRSFEASATKMLVKSERLDVTGIKNVIQRTVAGNVKNIHDLNNRLFMIDMQNMSKENLLELQKQWDVKEDVIYSSPVFIDETGREIAGLTDQIIVGLKHEADYPLLTKNVLQYQIKDIKQCEYDKQAYLLTLEKGSVKNAMQIANELHETGLYEYVEPNLIHFIELSTADTHYSQQWALKNTGQSGGTSGIDIKAEQAWGITTGSSNIRVAVLDVGVDLNHPDLVNNLLPGFDATGNNSVGAPTGNTGDPAHGTACVGIIAAKANNNRGITGVAYNCRILPVRIATRSRGWITTESQFIANGINWACQNGADIVSMSFDCIPTTALNTAIANAVNTGRNNRGCVLVAASGNGGNTNQPAVRYPASSQHVIAVGAINRNSNRADFSDYGNNLDVVAPGVGIYTTCMLGVSGYTVINNGVNGIYTSNFNGTSAACPHVAGIAALILSVRPDLTQVQVRKVIESTCTKLLEYSYSNNSAHPNGTWNNQVGHGLVNAYAAVNSVVPKISGYSYVCCEYAPYVLNMPLPADYTVSWSSSSNMVGVVVNSIYHVRASATYPSAQGTVSATIRHNNQVCAVVNKQVTVQRPVVIPTAITLSVVDRWSSNGTTKILLKAGDQNGLPWLSCGDSMPGYSFLQWYSNYGTIISTTGQNYDLGIDNPDTDDPVTDENTTEPDVEDSTSVPDPIGFRSGDTTDGPPDDNEPAVPYDPFYAVLTVSPSNSPPLYEEIEITCTFNGCFSLSGSLSLPLYTGYSHSSYLSDSSSHSEVENGIFVYPNPASSTLHVEIDPSKKANVSAGNMVRKAGGTCEVQMVAVQTGALVLRHTVKDFDTNFDLNLTTVPDGLYLLRLVQNGQTVHTKNILVQH